MTATPKDAGTQLPDQARTAGQWSVVPADSQARFHVRDKLVTTVHGSLPVEDGSVVLADDGTVAHAWLSLSVPGIATGNVRRDRDLQKPQFLAAATSASIRVDVETTTPTPTGCTARAVVHARGHSAPLDLTVQAPATIYGAATDTSAGEIRIRVTGRLDRTPLGIKAPSFVIGRFLEVEAGLTFRRQAVRRGQCSP
jgi:polyisoprenoid-binding protein YceI